MVEKGSAMGSGEASSRQPVELVLAFYIHVMGLLILGVRLKSRSALETGAALRSTESRMGKVA